MFQRCLIANRGEVAVRIARGCRELGIEPVGVYSEADRGAAWLSAMAESVCLGPASAAQSYLHAERIVQAALQTRCGALHPGWGFLAEDARFAALCAQHGVVFVGPSPSVMARMGVKTPAKRAMHEAGVPVVPGSLEPLPDLDAVRACAKETGFPALLKAERGGGGRGMRLVHSEDELEEAFLSASSEALSAFGSGAMYMERYLAGGRHVEVQVIADGHGRALHLFERDCSVQRRHQKLIEEAPCPLLSESERAELGTLAANAALAIGYRGAGTIEFMRAADGEMYFLEMNTRLQVEHPVTEMLCGLDIVDLQLRVAADGALPLEQEDVRLDGHAIECRINAEDPSQDFRPSPGHIGAFDFPDDRGPGRLRVDTHLAAGERVSPHYDSLVAKVIAHGADREEAIQTLIACLSNARVEGISTTIPLHLAVLQSDAFRSNEYDTSAIPGWPPA